MTMIKPDINAADQQHLNKTAEDSFYTSATFDFRNEKKHAEKDISAKDSDCKKCKNCKC